MIPKPTAIVKAPDSPELQTFLQVNMINSLTETEVIAYGLLEGMLGRKVNLGDLIIDITKLNKYFNDSASCAMTEFMCRRIINRYEYDHHGTIVFLIINGTAEWKSYDDIRKRAIDRKNEV